VQLVAIGKQLSECPHVITLGVRPQFSSYSPEEITLIRSTPAVLFPTWRYVTIFDATGKPTFPSISSYQYRRSLHLQASLCTYLNIPSLKIRLYAGNRQKKNIYGDFTLPVKIIYGQNRETIAYSQDQLRKAIMLTHKVIIQECPGENDPVVELVVIGYQVVGMTSCFSLRPLQQILKLSEHICKKAHIDYASMRWVYSDNSWKFLKMTHPPLQFKDLTGKTVLLKKVLCKFIKDIATGRAIPPWQRI